MVCTARRSASGNGRASRLYNRKKCKMMFLIRGCFLLEESLRWSSSRHSVLNRYLANPPIHGQFAEACLLFPGNYGKFEKIP